MKTPPSEQDEPRKRVAEFLNELAALKKKWSVEQKVKVGFEPGPEGWLKTVAEIVTSPLKKG